MRNEAGKRLRNQPEALEAQRPVQSDLGEKSYPPAQAIAHVLVKGSPWEVISAQHVGQDNGSPWKAVAVKPDSGQVSRG